MFLGLLNEVAHKLKSLFISNLNIYLQHQTIIYFTKIVCKYSVQKYSRPLVIEGALPYVGYK